MYRIILNSQLTGGIAMIVTPFIDNKGDPRYQVHQTLNSGCTVVCNQVHSLSRGVVVFIGSMSKSSVIVQYDGSTCITYANLKSVAVTLNQPIETSTIIGEADEYVLVELLQFNGTSRVWPVRVGAYQYYKQDPEKLISGEFVLSDEGASAFGSQAYPQSFDYTLLQPYVITLNTQSPQTLDFDRIRQLRISGVIMDAGRLFDSNHVRQRQFMNPKLPQWLQNISNSGMLYGFYFHGCATNSMEAADEIYELSYVIRNWPPALGVWVKPEFSRTQVTNDLVIDTYRDKLFALGLSGAIGFYTTRSALATFSWSSKQSEWLLWLVDHCNAVSDFDTALTPDFFRLEN